MEKKVSVQNIIFCLRNYISIFFSLTMPVCLFPQTHTPTHLCSYCKLRSWEMHAPVQTGHSFPCGCMMNCSCKRNYPNKTHIWGTYIILAYYFYIDRPPSSSCSIGSSDTRLHNIVGLLCSLPVVLEKSTFKVSLESKISLNQHLIICSSNSQYVKKFSFITFQVILFTNTRWNASCHITSAKIITDKCFRKICNNGKSQARTDKWY